MSSTLRYTVVAGPLTLSRMALVVIAEEVGAHLVRGLDGIGLLAVGLDAETARSQLPASALSPDLAGCFGSAAAVSRRRLRALSLAEHGDRAVLVTRYQPDRVASFLLGADATLGTEVSATFDEVVQYGSVSGLTTDEFVVDEFGPETFASRWWSRSGLPGPAPTAPAPASGTSGERPEAVLSAQDVAELYARAVIDPTETASALVDAGLRPPEAQALVEDLLAGMPATRVQAWWRNRNAEEYASLTWLTGEVRTWVLDDPESGDQVLALRYASTEEIGALGCERFASVR